ncbi:MAG: riboflavin synthase, alpha subunit [Bacteroidota bacterium]|jgi:riboflavin synthase
MFTGIVESIGTIVGKRAEAANIHLDVACNFLEEIKIDQSIAHDGVCLTVVAITQDFYTVTVIQETINKTCLSQWEVGQTINLERAMPFQGRLDGHIVQGHVDTTAICMAKVEEEGSWRFTFQYNRNPEWLTIEKGSICVNGTSLTVVDSGVDTFSVCIIPFTYTHTTIHNVEVGKKVNLEFDVFGKYVLKYAQAYQRTFAQ